MPAKHPIKTLPPREYLLACFDYDPDTGALTWKRRPREHFPSEGQWTSWNTRFASKQAGGLNNKGYRVIVFRGNAYKAYRLIWKWMTGEEPPDNPDHKDGNPDNNRWANLRPATQPQQSWNTRLHKDNSIGFRGVQRTPSGKFAARIWIDGAYRSLGSFNTPEEAAAAREPIARQQRGEFYR